MKYKNILILSTTRTGSSYIKSFFYNNGISHAVDPRIMDLKTNKNNILHICQHNGDPEINFKKIPSNVEWHVILSSRKNKFDQICSEEIKWHTGQAKVYNYYKFTLELDLNRILTRYDKIINTEKKWSKIIKKTKNFIFSTKILKEELDNGDDILYKTANKIEFTIEKNDRFKKVEKSPYNQKDVISNYKELEISFNKYKNLIKK